MLTSWGPPGSDISVRRPFSGETVASVVVYHRGVRAVEQRSSQESECQQSIKLYVNSVFVRPDRARALYEKAPRAASRSSDSSSRRAAASRRALLPADYLRACVRAPASPAQRSVASELSQVSHVYLSAAARECLSSVVHMCDSVCGEIATTSSSGVPKVSTVREPLSEKYRSCCCLISRAEKTCADVDVHVCKQRGTII